MKKALFSLLVTAALVMSGCATKASTQEYGVVEAPRGAPSYDGAYSEAPAPMATSMPSLEYTQKGIENAAGEVKPMIVTNADMSIVVVDPIASQQSIIDMAVAMGGFVVSSNTYQSETRTGIIVPGASVTVRVPSEKLKDLMAKVEALTEGIENGVISKNVSGYDVSKDYTDLSSRLRNLEDAEQQLTKIMQDAKTTEDVLSVYNELNNIRQQIEVIKGQMKYYEDASSTSSLAVNLQAEESIEPLTIGGWKPAGTARDAVQTLLDALRWLGDAAIWVGLFCLPIGLLLGVPAFFIIRGIRRAVKKSKATKDVEQTPAEPKS